MGWLGRYKERSLIPLTDTVTQVSSIDFNDTDYDFQMLPENIERIQDR
jgi:hypothetical protein